jgi:hypothetical protein
MRSFTVNGTEYLGGKIPGKTLWHVVRRLAPAITAVTNLVPVLSVAKQIAERPEGGLDLASRSVEDVAELIGALRPALVELRNLSNDDMDFVLDTCASVAQRQNKVGPGWNKVVTNGAYNDQDDENMVVRLAICWNVLIYNLDDVLAFVGVKSLGAGAG